MRHRTLFQIGAAAMILSCAAAVRGQEQRHQDLDALRDQLHAIGTQLDEVRQQLEMERPAEQRERRPEVEQEVRVFQLQHGNPMEIMETVQRTFRIGSVAPVERARALVVREEPAMLDQVASLIAQLDRPEMAPAAAETLIYDIKHRRADQVAGLVGDLFPASWILPDDASRKIVVRGPQEEVQRIEAMLRQLDVPHPGDPDDPEPHSRTLLLTYDVIRARTGADTRGALPSNLQEVGEALLAEGVGDFVVVGHLRTMALESEPAESTGITQQGAWIRTESLAELHDHKVTLQLRWRVEVPRTENKDGPPVPHGEFGVNTTITVALGDYVVVGAVPSRIDESDTLLLVLRVTPA